MKVLQLIDSLRPGGAEKMAVNIANALLPLVEGSYLCSTRLEGSLKKNIKSEVTYFHLNKKRRYSLKAFLQLKNIIKENEIQIVHAHGTSFFLPVILKFFGIKFILIWHIHNGGIKYLTIFNQKLIAFFSHKFDGIIAVNSEIKQWASKKLYSDQVIEIKNFIAKTEDNNSIFQFNGDQDSFKIVCIANVRPEKGHLYLIEGFAKINVSLPCSLHLIGSLPDNFEASEIFRKYESSNKKGNIHFYGVREEISEILCGADLGLLVSDYEGLPLALLEYGYFGLPVIVTDVGYCKEIVGENGIVIPPKNSSAITAAIESYLKDSNKRKKDAMNFHQFIIDNYSEHNIFPQLLAFYKKIYK